MNKLLLFVLSAFMLVSCADKVSPEDERPPHMQDQETPADKPGNTDTPGEDNKEPSEGPVRCDGCVHPRRAGIQG